MQSRLHERCGVVGEGRKQGQKVGGHVLSPVILAKVQQQALPWVLGCHSWNDKVWQLPPFQNSTSVQFQQQSPLPLSFALPLHICAIFRWCFLSVHSICTLTPTCLITHISAKYWWVLWDRDRTPMVKQGNTIYPPTSFNTITNAY